MIVTDDDRLPESEKGTFSKAIASSAKLRVAVLEKRLREARRCSESSKISMARLTRISKGTFLTMLTYEPTRTLWSGRFGIGSQEIASPP